MIGGGQAGTLRQQSVLVGSGSVRVVVGLVCSLAAQVDCTVLGVVAIPLVANLVCLVHPVAGPGDQPFPGC
jgi:hypothetical protein